MAQDIKKSKIEIKSNNNLFTEIFIDGHKINGVRRFALTQEAGNKFPILTIDLNAFDLTTNTYVLKMCQQGLGDIESIKFKGDGEPVTV